MPTKSRGCCAVPRTPASPTMPMAKPAARPDSPTLRPAPRWAKALQQTHDCRHLSFAYCSIFLVIKQDVFGDTAYVLTLPLSGGKYHFPPGLAFWKKYPAFV